MEDHSQSWHRRSFADDSDKEDWHVVAAVVVEVEVVAVPKTLSDGNLPAES